MESKFPEIHKQNKSSSYSKEKNEANALKSRGANCLKNDGKS